MNDLEQSLGTPAGRWMVLIATAVGLWILDYGLRLVRGAREGIRWRLRLMARAYLTLGLVGGLMVVLRRPPVEALFLGFIAATLIIVSTPSRSRRIPNQVRKNVVARFEAETGERYDPSYHHLDHIVPFSRGGSHTEDNLRVVPKRKNLRKGRRMPRYDEFQD